MKRYRIFSLRDSDEWRRTVSLLPQSCRDVYYLPEYYSLYESYGDGRAVCLVFEEGDNLAVYPFLINSVNKLGFHLRDDFYDIQGAYGYNGMISNTNDQVFISDFWSFVDDYCQNNNVIAEFTRFHPLINNYLLNQGHFDILFNRNTVVLDVNQSLERISQKFDRGTRQHIRKAIKTIEIRPVYYSEENVRVFNEIYRMNMEHVHSIPYLFFSEEHFRNMFKLNNIEFFIAYLDGMPIACYSGLVSEEYYGNYLRASITEYNKTGVNTLMYWSMIQSAKAHGCHYVHFGGGSNADPDNSLLRYKMNFSKELADFYIGRKVHNKNVYDEVVRQWQENYPESFSKNKNMLLGYREL